MHILPFVSFLFYFEIKFNFGLQIEVIFENDVYFNNKVCRNEMVFGLHCLSAIHCAAMCRSNASCFCFFYDDHRKECTGCLMAYEQHEQHLLASASSWTTYFYESSQRRIPANQTVKPITSTTSLLPTVEVQPNIYVILEELTYVNAKAECSVDGYLAVVDSSDENNFLVKKMEEEGVVFAFLGMIIQNGKLVHDFQDEVEATFTNNVDINQYGNCVVMDTLGKWFTVS